MSLPHSRKIIKDGVAYYRISDAAKLLGTNTAKIKALMASGQLEWIQSRAGSKTFLINADSILKCKYPGTVIVRLKGS
jgi:hypothetical protein